MLLALTLSTITGDCKSLGENSEGQANERQKMRRRGSKKEGSGRGGANVEKLDIRLASIFFPHHLVPGAIKNAVGELSALPDVDAAHARAIFAHDIILAQQAGNALVFVLGALKCFGNFGDIAAHGQAECHDGDNHARHTAAKRWEGEGGGSRGFLLIGSERGASGCERRVV